MRAMGRKPTKNLNLPPRMRARERRGTTWYYYDCGGKPRKETPLGNDYTIAVGKWAELEGGDTSTGSIITFKDAADTYLRKVFPAKAARTQKENLFELESLLKFFNNPPAPLDNIKPIHIRQYMDWRIDQTSWPKPSAPSSSATSAPKPEPIKPSPPATSAKPKNNLATPL